MAVPLDAADRLCGKPEIALSGVPESDGMIALSDWVMDAVERAIPSNGRLSPPRAENEIQRFVRGELARRWEKAESHGALRARLRPRQKQGKKGRI